MQSMEAVRANFYENEWLLHAMEKLARSMIKLIELTKGHRWPQMPKVLQGR
jgi:hypothetical protein